MPKQPKRPTTIKVRLSHDERQVLAERKTRPHLARWMREFCLGAAPVEREPDDRPKVTPPPVDPALLRQLAGIGNNINQIARVVNRDGDPIDRAQVLAQLAGIERELVALRRAHEPPEPPKKEGEE